MSRPTKLTPETPSNRRETARHAEAFEAWYAAGRSVRKISEKFSETERQIYKWADWFNWHARADERDRKISGIVEREAIKARVKRLEDQRKAGTLLRNRGMQHLQNNVIGDAKTAIAAIRTGVDIERQSDGLPDWVMAVMNLSADELDTKRAEAEAELQRREIERRGTSAFCGGGEDSASDTEESD